MLCAFGNLSQNKSFMHSFIHSFIHSFKSKTDYVCMAIILVNILDQSDTDSLKKLKDKCEWTVISVCVFIHK